MATKYGVTENGFVRKPINVIIDSLNKRFVGKFGATFDTSPESPDGQVIGIVADEIHTCWQQSELSFNAYRPGAVQKVGLDNICELTKVKRYVDKPTTCTVLCGGAADTLVPAGSLVGDGTMEFRTLFETIIPGDVTVEAVRVGEYYVAPNTITKIITQVSGWTSVDNQEEGQTGITYEEDPALRVRRDQTTAIDSATTVEAIYAGLVDLGLEYIRIRDNDTLESIGEQPAGTVMVVVDGGTKNDIARRIYESKTGGVPTFGDVSVTVSDSKGFPHVINFSRSSDSLCYVKGTFKRRAGSNISSNDTAQHLEEATYNYVNGLKPGMPLIWSELFCPLMESVRGVELVTLDIGISASVLSHDTIEVDINKRNRVTADTISFEDVTK